MASIPIGELLVDNGQITPEELEQAEAENKKTGEPIASVLAKLGFITENSLKNALELQYGVMYMNLSKREPDEELISMLPEKMIREQQAVPVAQQGERLTLAMVDPNDAAAISEIQKTLNGKQVKPVVCLEEQFVKFVDKAFHVEEKTTNGNGNAPSNGAEPNSEAEAKTDEGADAKSVDAAIIGTIVEPETADVKTESAADGKSESEPEAKIESAPEATTESAPEATTESAPEATTESAPEATIESAPEATTESAPEATTESAPEATTESAPEAETEATPADAASQSGAEAALALSRAETAIAKAEAGLAKAETAIAKAQVEPSQSASETKSDSTMYSNQPSFDTQEMKARPAPTSESAATSSESIPDKSSEYTAPANEPAAPSTAQSAPTATESESAKDEESAPKSEADHLTETDLAKRAQEEAIVLLANQILGSAIKRHCSNIHITTGPRESLVKYRLNGRLIVDRKLPNTIVVALVARYKMMARLNLAERKEPQDGHIKVKSAAKEIVCLISVVPQDHGENVVIWIV